MIYMTVITYKNRVSSKGVYYSQHTEQSVSMLQKGGKKVDSLAFHRLRQLISIRGRHLSL